MRVDTGGLRVVSADAAAALDVHEHGSSDGEVLGAASDEAREIEATDAARDLGLSTEAPEDYASPGPYIMAQRKRRGMSLDQLAVATKIPRRQLELLEADRYEELPGMVFAKGFLRVCARALELDEDTVLGLLYERERVQLRQRRREASNVTPTDARRPIRPVSSTKRGASPDILGRISDYVSGWLGQLPSARIVMWLVVALLVALVVFIAFTLASSQAEPMMIRS